MMRNFNKKIACFLALLCLLTSGAAGTGKFFKVASSDTGTDEIQGDTAVDDTVVIDSATVNFADDKLVNAYYQMDCAINNEPTVVLDGVDERTIAAAVSGEEKPSNVILRFDESCNIVAENGEAIGSFESVYEKYLKDRCIPVLRIESDGAATAFLSSMDDFALFDVSVMSSDTAVLKKLRTAATWLRGILRVEEPTDLSQTVAAASACGAAVVMLCQKDATMEAVNYIQARFKSVWVETDGYLFSDIYHAINSGAYGIVSAYYKDVYDAFRTYTGDSLVRTPFNVAHRGCPNLTHENSLGGVRLAVQNGATHLELDGYLTKDNEIVMMHDSDLSRTTNGTGLVESYTLAQLKEFDLDLYEPYEKIPTLQEVLDEIKDTEVILVFEIKSDKTAIVDRFKSVVEEYGMNDRCVVITFDENILAKMRESFCEMPVAYLENSTKVDFWVLPELLLSLGEYTAAIDKNYQKGTTTGFNRYLKDRGYAGWYWTFKDDAALSVGKELGFVGLTTNAAETFKTVARSIQGENATSFAVGDAVELIVTTYAGEKRTVTGEIFYSRKTLGGYYLVSRYRSSETYLYTQTYFVSVAEQGEP